MMKRKFLTWLSIGTLVFCGSILLRSDPAHAQFGEDIPFLVELVTQAIQQVSALTQIIGTTRDTVGLLEEMNRGVKEVLHLAETAHIPLPPQIYGQAKRIDQATETAERVFGTIPGSSPTFAKTQYRSGVEGLQASEDAYDYADFLDEQGRKIKSSALVASQSTATRLTAESVGVLIQGLDHTNRLEAKNLEISSTNRIESAAKESARYQSFVDTHDTITRDTEASSFSSLSSFDEKEGGP